MIFPKRAKKNSNLEFHIGKEYKYKFQKESEEKLQSRIPYR